jgi:beta-N-acetylhexosaminidase
MPGHGRALVDSHKELPVVTAPAEELEADIAPFRQLALTPIGMSAHIVYTAWDSENPATLSSRVISNIIREAIGFDGLLLTDDIDMEALTGTVPERAERAIAAGCDVVLNCWAKMDDMEGIASRLPPLSPRGQERLTRALDLTQPEGDEAERVGALLAKRDALLAAAGLAA